MKYLEKERARRYETDNGLVMDVPPPLHDELIVARQRSGKPERRSSSDLPLTASR